MEEATGIYLQCSDLPSNDLASALWIFCLCLQIWSSQRSPSLKPANQPAKTRTESRLQWWQNSTESWSQGTKSFLVQLEICEMHSYARVLRSQGRLKENPRNLSTLCPCRDAKQEFWCQITSCAARLKLCNVFITHWGLSHLELGVRKLWVGVSAYFWWKQWEDRRDNFQESERKCFSLLTFNFLYQ